MFEKTMSYIVLKIHPNDPKKHISISFYSKVIVGNGYSSYEDPSPCHHGRKHLTGTEKLDHGGGKVMAH